MEGPRLDDLRQRATLREYRFASPAPLVGGLLARLRAAWNDVATKWQVRPLMEQQSAFNTALTDWLERAPDLAEVDRNRYELDRRQTRVVRAVGAMNLAARRLWPRAEQTAPLIAYFSPQPPARSGIADYSAELLPHLAALADVTLFANDPERIETAGLPAQRAADFPALRNSFDLPLYQMGNSDQHEWMIDVLLRYPGIVVLHDYFLHHFIAHHTLVAGRWGAYARELEYELEGRGRGLARSIRYDGAPTPLFELPMNRRILDTALGVIVHSRYAAELARRARPDLPLAVVPALVETHPGVSRRASLGIADEAVIFASYGQITPEKQVGAALSAFGTLAARRRDAHYLLAGETHPALDIDGLVADLGLGERVHAIGYVPDRQSFIDWIHTADVVVNLRQPTVGETSAIALRAMAAARPLIVYDHGWYAELPDDAALKVPPGDEAALLPAMERLAASAELRRSMGQAGLAYVQAHCRPPRVAARYVEFIRKVIAGVER